MERRLFTHLCFICHLVIIVQSSRVDFVDCPKGCTCGLPEEADPLRTRTQDIVVLCDNQDYTDVPSDQIACDIKRLEMPNNKIKRLTRNSFRGLQQLEDIDLQNNQIEYIEAGTFAGLPNLRSVNLVGNKFVELDERPFWGSEFPSITIEVQDNPFWCNHEMKRTYKQIEGKVVFSGLRCKEVEREHPVRSRNKPSKNVEYDRVYDKIRMRLASWKIGLIASSCWAGFWAIVVILYFASTYSEGKITKKVYKQVKHAKEEIASKKKAQSYEMDEYDPRDPNYGRFHDDGDDRYPRDDRYPHDDRYPQDDRYHHDDRYPQDDRYPHDDRDPRDDRYYHDDRDPRDDRYPDDDRYPRDDRYPSERRYPSEDGRQSPRRYDNERTAEDTGRYYGPPDNGPGPSLMDRRRLYDDELPMMMPSPRPTNASRMTATSHPDDGPRRTFSGGPPSDNRDRAPRESSVYQDDQDSPRTGEFNLGGHGRTTIDLGPQGDEEMDI